jgi:hypothetical protein
LLVRVQHDLPIMKPTIDTQVCSHPKKSLTFLSYSEETSNRPGKYVRHYMCKLCLKVVNDDNAAGVPR